MKGQVRHAVAPAYLFLCLLLGGSTQGIWSNLLLQLLAIAIIAWAALHASAEPSTRHARQLYLLLAAAVTLTLLQLVPLPPALWTSLPGRRFIEEGYRLLGVELPWLPISVTPYETLASLPALLPPIAMLLAMLRLRAYSRRWLTIALAVGTLAGVLLGVLQVSDPQEKSSWYLYRYSNFGVATGFFANANHMATLLIMTVPLLAAFLSQSKGGGQAVQRYTAMLALVGGALAVILVGLILNGSLAGLALGVPVVAASALLLTRPRPGSVRLLLLGTGLLLLVGIGIIFARPVDGASDTYGATTSVETRREMFGTAAEIARDFAPVGSGVGSFERVYRPYEDPTTLDRTYVNHAHNDYLQIAAEAGLPGIILLLLFLGWWGLVAWQRWLSSVGDNYARAATIASGAVLAHSFVDYPLRTAAIATAFAMCLSLMAQTRRSTSGEAKGPALWQARHLEVR